ncbi:Glutamate receptor 2 [Holothuria leucospilota]|uniref:Glutamate receptor 2 n=1 Tax=Holothuria leucospilota TaxID=206669 RepID=A0A9Q1C1D0_HOLLE|nr:Glutamate receptor 2 [Holothuria leucospilota]
MKRSYVVRIFLALWMSLFSNGEQLIKVASFYGKYTGVGDIYKDIMTDATTYINDDRGGQQIIPSGDQVNVIHQNLLSNRVYEDQTLSKSVYQICNDLRSTLPSVVITPDDFCSKCGGIGRVLGEAYSPVFTLDQADGSGAFKMRPNLDDMEEMITDVIAHFKWRAFIFLYEANVGIPLVEAMGAKAVKYEWSMTPIEVEKDFEKQAEELKKRFVKNILIFTHEDTLEKIITVAFETKLLSNEYHWIFGNLNPPITESFLEQYYRHNMAFLTRFKIVSNDLLYYTSNAKPIKQWKFRQRAAYDALVASSMAMKLHFQAIGRYPAPVATCGTSEKSTLEPFIKQVKFRGASGDVAFNEHGDRVNYTVNIYSGKDRFAQNLAGYFVQDTKSWEIANGEKWPGKPGKRTYMTPFRQSDARFIKVLAVPGLLFGYCVHCLGGYTELLTLPSLNSHTLFKHIPVRVSKKVLQLINCHLGPYFIGKLAVFICKEQGGATIVKNTETFWTGIVSEVINPRSWDDLVFMISDLTETSMQLTWEHIPTTGIQRYFLILMQSVTGETQSITVDAGTVPQTFVETFNGLTPATEYLLQIDILTDGSTAAENFVGPNTVFTRPYPPEFTLITQTAENAVRFEWLPPTMGDFDGFLLELSSAHELIFIEKDQFFYEVSELISSVEYEFGLYCYAGLVDPANYVSSSLGTTDFVPFAPIGGNVRIDSITSSSLNVLWDAIPDAGSYLVTLVDANNQFVNGLTVDGQTTQLAFPGLDPSTTYEARVEVVLDGVSFYAGENLATTLPVGDPSGVVNVLSTTKDTITIDYTEIQGATSYQIIFVDETGATRMLTSAGSPFTIPGLDPATEYIIQVNGLVGGQTQLVGTTAGTTGPYPPEFTLITQTAENTVRFEWLPPTMGDFDGFLLVLSSEHEPIFIEKDQFFYEVSELISSVEYEFGLYCYAGLVDPANYVSSNLGPTDFVPFAPIDGNVRIDSITSSSLNVLWDAIPDAESYLVTLVDANNQFVNGLTVDGQTTQLAFPGLDPSTTYEARVEVVLDGVSFYAGENLATTLPVGIPSGVVNVLSTTKDTITIDYTEIQGATSYQVIFVDETGATRMLTSTGSPFTIPGLDPATEYNIQVNGLVGGQTQLVGTTAGTTGVILNCPERSVIVTMNNLSTSVFWPEPITSLGSKPLDVTSNYESGDKFLVGNTKVKYRFQNLQCVFTVTVQEKEQDSTPPSVYNCTKDEVTVAVKSLQDNVTISLTEPYAEDDSCDPVMEPPFFMEKGWEALRYPNEKYNFEETDLNEERYEGYSWELLKEVKKFFEEEMEIPFDFQVTLMSPGQYGSLDLSTGEWDGMIRELIDGDADLAIGSLTKNGAREKDIDFTASWYGSHLKVAILHPSWTFEYPFALVYPYHLTAWFALLVTFLVIVLAVFCLGRFSPYEYRRLASRGEASEEEGETFSFFDSIWFLLSTGFWQSYIRGPRSWSLRILSAFWFYFALCIIFLYSENVNSVFKFSKTAIKIKDVQDLLSNDVIDFGAVRNSPSYDFYRYNKGQYRMVFDRMLNSEKNLLEDSIEQAIYRIRRQWDGRYAVLGEERILNYAAARKPCRIFVTGKTLGKISFSFATPSGSPLLDQLSYAIKSLKKRGNISRILEMKFSNSLHCEPDTLFEKETKKSFTIHDFQGMYYLMLTGIGASVIVFGLEWLVFLLFFGKSSRPKQGIRRPGRPKGNNSQASVYGLEPSKSTAPDNAPTDWL